MTVWVNLRDSPTLSMLPNQMNSIPDLLSNLCGSVLQSYFEGQESAMLPNMDKLRVSN